MRRGNFPDRKNQKCKDAQARQEVRNKRSNAQQLAKLDSEGHVATKERKKLEEKSE